MEIVSGAIIRLQKIRRQPLADWNLKSFVGFAGSTHLTKKQSNRLKFDFSEVGFQAGYSLLGSVTMLKRKDKGQ